MRSFMKVNILFSFVFAAILLGCSEKQSQTIPERSVRVKTMPLQEHAFREIFRAQGMVEPARKGTVSAFVPGRIDKIYYDEGSIAEPGKSLFQIDRENFSIQVEIARKDLEVMKSARLSTQQNVKLDQIKLEKAELDFNRAKTLYQSKAISTDAYEQAETNYNGAKVSLDGAVAIDNAAAAKVQQAETALKLAQKALEDSHPSVPFRALILEKLREESEFAGAGTPILIVEDPASREISCRISAIYWERMKPGTVVDVFFGGEKVCRTSIYFRAEVIDPASRTFEIKAKLPEDTVLKSGTLCDMEMILSERNGRGVPTDAVLPGRSGQMSVFVNENGTAKAYGVQCGISSDGITEVLSSGNLEGKEIIISGQAFVREGDKLEVER